MAWQVHSPSLVWNEGFTSFVSVKKKKLMTDNGSSNLGSIDSIVYILFNLQIGNCFKIICSQGKDLIMGRGKRSLS